MKYIILSANTSQELMKEVDEFLKNKYSYNLLGGPYSDGNYHYQALFSNYTYEQLQQLNG